MSNHSHIYFAYGRDGQRLLHVHTVAYLLELAIKGDYDELRAELRAAMRMLNMHDGDPDSALDTVLLDLERM